MALSRLFLFFSCLGLLGLGHLAALTEADRAFFVFGDSIVDVGNNNYLRTLAQADAYPYGIDYPTHQPTGRFSNGLNSADVVSEHFGLESPLPYLSPDFTGEKLLAGANFASAAAGILNDTGVVYGEVLKIGNQLESFEEYQQRLGSLVGEKEAERRVNEALVMISLGGNDFINNYYIAPLTPRSLEFAMPDYVTYVISEYKQILMSLYNLGARYVLVEGCGPVGCAPGQLANIKSNGECKPEPQRAAKLFNSQLVGVLNELNSELGADIFVFVDIFNPMMDIINNPQAYGFETAKVACCGIGPYNGLRICSTATNLCTNRDLYVFWDTFHPTEKVIRIVMNRVAAELGI